MFRLDLEQASYRLWMLLGEAQSKCRHLRGAPLLPEVKASLGQVFLAKGALATTAIEGNTLTEDEVRRHLEGELELPPSKQYLGQEIDNVVEAYNQVIARILKGESLRLDPKEIRAYNRLILRDLPLGEGVIPGEICQHRVTVGSYPGAPPEDCEYLLGRLCRWLNDDFDHPDDYPVAFGILKAIIAHLYIAWIHPFGDGNGRTARLIEFQILFAVGVPAISAHLLSDFYNQTRSEYYRQLDRAHRSGGDVLPFVEYALQGFVDGLANQIEWIQGQQVQVHWINHVHNAFRGKDSRAEQRQRHLILAISERGPTAPPVPLGEIRYVNPQIAEMYAGISEKTIQRDAANLEAMGLLVRAPAGLMINSGMVMAFFSTSFPDY